MLFPIPDTPELAQLRADVRAAEENHVALTRKAAADRASLEPLSHRIAQTLANGQHHEADQLRAERSAAEVRLRDYEAAERIASDRVEAADRALARVEAPLMASILRDHAALFHRQVAELVKSAAALRAMRPQYAARFHRCGHDERTPHPDHPRTLARLSPLPAQLSTMLADYTPEV